MIRLFNTNLYIFVLFAIQIRDVICGSVPILVIFETMFALLSGVDWRTLVLYCILFFHLHDYFRACLVLPYFHLFIYYKIVLKVQIKNNKSIPSTIYRS